MEIDVKTSERWFGPLGAAELSEIERLGMEEGDCELIADLGETWAVFRQGAPEVAMPMLASAIAVGGKTVGPIAAVQRREAARRLKMLEGKGLHPDAVRQFEVEGLVNYSDRISFGHGAAGGLFWIDESNFAARIMSLEKSEGFIVYHATHEHTNFGELLDLFHVSKDVEEWGIDREDIEGGYSLVYAVNLDDDSCSEYGSIGFSVSGGGLVRTA